MDKAELRRRIVSSMCAYGNRQPRADLASHSTLDGHFLTVLGLRNSQDAGERRSRLALPGQGIRLR